MAAGSIDAVLSAGINKVLKKLYTSENEDFTISLQQTRPEFKGSRTLVVFPYLKLSGKGPEQTANEIGQALKDNLDFIRDFNAVKGFLNLEFTKEFWLEQLKVGYTSQETKIGVERAEKIMVEYSSPNTNKPLHLGHIRNILLGFSVSQIAKKCGKEAWRVQIINDRGIHICKSMLAWQKFGNDESPESSGKKGDHLVGDYYVLFDKHYKKEIASLVEQGMKAEEAEKKAPILLEAQQMLVKWEKGDKEVISLWETMNSWVYKGFDQTYKNLGVEFDKNYYESETYLLGRKVVLEGIEKGIFIKEEDGSVWVDLTDEGLDKKILMRSDGTTVYMTQDIGTAIQRFEDEVHLSKIIYTVGNEQNYHFKVLFKILKKLGYEWADRCEHLSYGMVELPSGKMKSREGTVVDADDLIEEMIETAKRKSEELGKLEGLSKDEKEKLYKVIGMGALKYYILRVDPKKQMVFNPEESIDFVGNTGPFIQYAHARIRTLVAKSGLKDYELEFDVEDIPALFPVEVEIINHTEKYKTMIELAYLELNPSIIANYTYDLVKSFNQFYQSVPILKEENENVKLFRLRLSVVVANIIMESFYLLGIDVPDRM